MNQTYKEILKLDYLDIEYNHYLYTCVKNKRKPFRMLQYNSSDCQTFIIFAEAQNGQIVTRHFRFSKSDAVFFRSWIASDFPELEYEIIDSPAKGEGGFDVKEAD